jgi:hypothetical protein
MFPQLLDPLVASFDFTLQSLSVIMIIGERRINLSQRQMRILQPNFLKAVSVGNMIALDGSIFGSPAPPQRILLRLNPAFQLYSPS